MPRSFPWEDKSLQEQFLRTSLLIGEDNVIKLNSAKVAVFGIGGVGSFTVEALARSGVGSFLLVDNDTVDITNINRQLHATLDTVGRYKTGLMRERILLINERAKVEILNEFCLPENVSRLLAGDFDYIVDAVDTVAAKLALIEEADARGIPIISAMGAGNKLDATRFEVADIFDTSVCPLCRVMRSELKKRGIRSLKVVYSREQPVNVGTVPDGRRRAVPGSIAFVPSVAGLILAGEVIKDLIK